MTYDPNIPTNLPSPKVSVDKIRTNFSTYADIFSDNHVAINKSNQGKHENMIFQIRGFDPDVTSDQCTLYGKRVTTNSSADIQLFSRISNFLPTPNSNTPIQLTFNTVNVAGPVYQSFISGGYIVYFGSSVKGTITLDPKPTEILCAIANSNNFTPAGVVLFPFNVSVSILSNFEFSINSTNVGGTFTWWVIAKQ